MIDPHPAAPGHWFVAVFHQKASAIDCDTRGLKYTPSDLRRRLKKLGFVQTAPWHESDATGELPDYLPEDQERWDLEGKKLAYYDKHGKFPELDDPEFALPPKKSASSTTGKRWPVSPTDAALLISAL